MYSSSGTPAPPGAIGMIVITRDEGEHADDLAGVQDVLGDAGEPERGHEGDAPRDLRRRS